MSGSDRVLAKYLGDNFSISRFDPKDGGRVRWSVSLPHQCGFWEIAEDVGYDRAIELLSRFLAEGRETLAWMRERTAEQAKEELGPI
jgi:hypothetical protein